MQGCVFDFDRQSLRRSPNDYFRDKRMAVNGSDVVDAVVLSSSWQEHMRSLANSMTLGAALAKR